MQKHRVSSHTILRQEKTCVTYPKILHLNDSIVKKKAYLGLLAAVQDATLLYKGASFAKHSLVTFCSQCSYLRFSYYLIWCVLGGDICRSTSISFTTFSDLFQGFVFGKSFEMSVIAVALSFFHD